ncbi:hypothetical protein P3G22_09685, partial [Rhodopseudomonas sp. BAL398]|nr:hypothetical protein [Rhodopseudomonas sp. BAL398]
MTATPSDILLGNARIVLADRVIDRGWVGMADGEIAEFGEGDAPGASENLGGDLLMPGLIELHTDHLEAHYVPRPKVQWDAVAAVVSYDGQLAVSGITTVLDSLRVWREEGSDDVDGQAGILADAIAAGGGGPRGRGPPGGQGGRGLHRRHLWGGGGGRGAPRRGGGRGG